MTKDIHPHWTSTDRNDAESPRSSSDASDLWQTGEETEMAPQAHHTHVAIQRNLPSALSLVMALLCLASLSVLFFYGIDRIRGDLLSEMRMEVVLTISDTGITPAEVTVKAGEKLSIRNDSSAMQQLASDQRTAEGSPLLRTALIAAGERGETVIPSDAAGTMILLRSTLLPTLAVSLSVEPAPPAQVSPPAMEEDDVSTQELPTAIENDALEIPIPELPVTPSVTNPVPVAVTPSLPSLPTPSPVVTVGTVPPPVSAWPSILRINRYTVSSPYVSPVHAVRYAEEAVREAVHSAAPREQPATGPALWVSVLLALGAMPMVFWKRRKA